jgi:methylmalonyl-CoA/ethylmalonyl-CoA epimerase
VKIKRVDHLGVIVDDLDGAVLPCGETLVELIEPLKEEGSNADYLREHGPGIQHVAFEVDDLEAALAELAERGVEPLGDAPMPGAGGMRIAFLDPQAFDGVLVELCEPIS